MAISSLIEAIENHEPVKAAGIAAAQRPSLLAENLNYHRITDNAAPYWEFAKAWVAIADTLDKPIIARWVVDIATSEFAYLEIQAEAAEMLIKAVSEAKNFLAELIGDMSILSDNPEAGLTKAQVRQLRDSADELRSISIPGTKD